MNDQKKNTRIVFMGTPEFAVHILDAMVKSGLNIVGVVTVADKPAGRGKKLQMSAVKKYALEHDLEVATPTLLKDPQFIDQLNTWKPDLQVVVAFRMLPKVVWSLPALGTFNLHASLLPQYRGAAPINWAIINGEKKSGVTTFFLDKKIDTGHILLQSECAINEDDNAGDLHDRLMEIGAPLVLKTIHQIIEGNTKPLAQDDIAQNLELKDAPKIFKEDCKINWNQPASVIYNFVRGLSPYPAAFTTLENKEKNDRKTVKIFKLEKTIEESNKTPGSIWTDKNQQLFVSTQDYNLKITELQLQGKKRLKVGDFLRGYLILESMRFVEEKI